MKRKTNAALLLVLAFALIAGACTGGGGGEYDLVKADTLTVCSDIPYAPFEFEEGGAYTGFDVELMGLIGAELDLAVEFIDSGFDSITSGTAMVGNECDIAASAITIKPEREENIDFSDGYFDADQSLMVKVDSGYSSYDDLVGLRLGVQAGTTGEAYANDNNPGGVEIVSFGESADLFVAMEAGDIQGILQDLPVNAERMLGDDSLTVVATYPTGEVYGFAVKEEGKEALLDAVNEALAAVKSDGTYDTLYDKYFK
jgi:polar amino acid transport system substrate-binding protein